MNTRDGIFEGGRGRSGIRPIDRRTADRRTGARPPSYPPVWGAGWASESLSLIFMMLMNRPTDRRSGGRSVGRSVVWVWSVQVGTYWRRRRCRPPLPKRPKESRFTSLRWTQKGRAIQNFQEVRKTPPPAKDGRQSRTGSTGRAGLKILNPPQRDWKSSSSVTVTRERRHRTQRPQQCLHSSLCSSLRPSATSSSFLSFSVRVTTTHPGEDFRARSSLSCITIPTGVSLSLYF